MAQVSTHVVANDTGAAVRAQLNGILAALRTMSAGATAPVDTVPSMVWIDTSGGSNPPAVKIRNLADNAWHDLLDGGTY